MPSVPFFLLDAPSGVLLTLDLVLGLAAVLVGLSMSWLLRAR